MVRAGGVEPPRAYTHCHLKTARLPFRHARRQSISLHLDCEVNKSACRGLLEFAGQSCRIGEGCGNGVRTQGNRPGRNLRACESCWVRILLGANLAGCESLPQPAETTLLGQLGDADEKLDHGRSGVGVDAFMAELDGYMEYYCEGRIKESLGWMSPNEYRRSLGYSS